MLMSLVESDVYTPTVVGGATSAKSTGLWEVKWGKVSSSTPQLLKKEGCFYRELWNDCKRGAPQSRVKKNISIKENERFVSQQTVIQKKKKKKDPKHQPESMELQLGFNLQSFWLKFEIQIQTSKEQQQASYS